jgi:hypothetical protein
METWCEVQVELAVLGGVFFRSVPFLLSAGTRHLLPSSLPATTLVRRQG